MELPDMPAGLTAGWLTGLMRSRGYLGEGAIVDVRLERIGDGSGMMSDVGRLHLRFDGDPGQVPASLVAKYPSANPTNRAAAVSFKLYERETRYFSELDALTTACTPRTYFSGWEGDNFLILMEDLGEYRVGDQVKGADLADSEALLGELAKLHGVFWNRVDDLDWLPHIAHSFHADNMKNLCQIGWPNLCEIFKDYIAPEIAARNEVFQENLPRLQEAMNTPPITLLHGDFRMENMLFGRKPEHQPIAIIDWQGPLRGRNMVDVALLLGQSTRTEVRREHERSLLAGYVDALTAQGVEDYGFEQAWADYQLAVLYNWVYVAVVAGTLDVHNERAFAWMSEMVARQSAASLDLDVFRLID